MKVLLQSIQLMVVALLGGCSPSSEESTTTEELTIPEAAVTQGVTVADAASQAKGGFEEQVHAYIHLFPHQDTYTYAMGFTGGKPERLNTWVQGAEPTLTRAGDDKIVRVDRA